MTTTEHPLLADLLANTERPCLSLYLPTHRTQPERRDDPTRYRALVRRLETSLEKTYSKTEVEALMRPFKALQEDEDFWNARREGIALFASPQVTVAQHLDRPVPELAIAANSFHLKPILRLLQTVETYHVLALTSERIALYVGDRDGLMEVDLDASVPRTLEEALGYEVTHRETTVMNAGGARMTHGHSTPRDESDLDTERFYRVIDKAIYDAYSRPSGLPLILAGLPEQLAVFHKVRKHNHNVLLEGIAAHPDALTVKDLTRRAWEVIEPYQVRYSRELVEKFLAAQANGKGLAEPREVAKAAAEGRIDVLFVEAERQIPGMVDPTTGDVEFDSLNHPEVDDLLDDVAELALRHKGRVLVLRTEHMPTATGIAAILRY